jgi:hypothetical protein
VELKLARVGNHGGLLRLRLGGLGEYPCVSTRWSAVIYNGHVMLQLNCDLDTELSMMMLVQFR